MTMPSKITAYAKCVWTEESATEDQLPLSPTPYIRADIAEELARALVEVKMLHNDGPPLPLDIDKRSQDALDRYNAAINP